MVGTRTSASRIASTMSAWDIVLSSRLRRASNSSRIRVSTSSGSRRVTTTRGLFLVMSAALTARSALPPLLVLSFRPAPINSSRRVNDRRRKWIRRRSHESRSAGLAPYQKSGQRQGWRDRRRGRRMRRDRRKIQAPGVDRRNVLALACAAFLFPRDAIADPVGSVTKLPLPRFASLKTDRVNLREGPSKDHATKWVYESAGLPVEITAEFEIWRKVRDSEGVEGWVLHSLLSGRRTAIVAPWKPGLEFTLYNKPSDHSDPSARLQSNVIGTIKTCDGAWC